MEKKYNSIIERLTSKATEFLKEGIVYAAILAAPTMSYNGALEQEDSWEVTKDSGIVASRYSGRLNLVDSNADGDLEKKIVFAPRAGKVEMMPSEMDQRVYLGLVKNL